MFKTTHWCLCYLRKQFLSLFWRLLLLKMLLGWLLLFWLLLLWLLLCLMAVLFTRSKRFCVLSMYMNYLQKKKIVRISYQSSSTFGQRWSETFGICNFRGEVFLQKDLRITRDHWSCKSHRPLSHSGAVHFVVSLQD